MNTKLAVAALALSFAAVGALRAQGTLQRALFDTDVAPHWIYDDFDAAREQARGTGKPILAVLRCVP
jgi:hypothetical protein